MAQYPTIPSDQPNFRLPTVPENYPVYNQPYAGPAPQAQYNEGKEEVGGGGGQPTLLPTPFNYNQNMMTQQQQQQYNMAGRGYGGYSNIQGQERCQPYRSQTNFPGPPRMMMASQMGGNPQSVVFPIQQSAPDSSLIGFQAVKLIRKIWGTPCGGKICGPQLFQCRPTCGGKAICKPVSRVVTKCQKPKKCPPPFQSCRITPQPQCSPSPSPQCCPRVKMSKCQYKVVSQPRRMVMMPANDCNPCQACPMTLVEEPGCSSLCRAAASVSQQHQCCEQPQTCDMSSRQYADMGVGCSMDDDRYMSARRTSSRNFVMRDSRDFMRDGGRCDRYGRDDFFDGYGYGGARGGCCDDDRFGCRARSCDNYDRDRCRAGASCDSCESFERWLEKCECRKKQKEACEKKMKDGQNDPKPIDQATSSDEKMGKKGKSVSVNTSKTKANKSKSKLKKSKSDGSVKKKKKGGKKKGKKGGKKGKKKK